METMSDTQLIVLSQEGSRRAFGLLARRQQGSLYRFLRRLLGDEEEARDTCQETLLRAFLNMNRLREPRQFKSWVHQIALNRCRDRGRSALRDAAGPGRVDDTTVEDLDAAVVAGSLAEGERVDLSLVRREVLGRLPLEQRTAILLREVQGFTSEEISLHQQRNYEDLRARVELVAYGLAASQQDRSGQWQQRSRQTLNPVEEDR